MSTDNVHSNTSQFIIYQSEDGQTRLDVRFVDESVWLTQALMAELFSTTPENVLMHLKNIFSEGELDQNATTKDFLVVRLFQPESCRSNIFKKTLKSRLVAGFSGTASACF
ncbi:RhuM family protein [Pseudomonas kitaguniensis]|uniref:RhuM family protein n=1 Tax=Pseudomonas kitaguniensis TaxID=2607908 RepID=UPI003CFF7174